MLSVLAHFTTDQGFAVAYGLLHLAGNASWAFAPAVAAGIMVAMWPGWALIAGLTCVAIADDIKAAQCAS